MTNLVPPLNQPTIETGTNSPVFSGSITNLSSEIGKLSVGQQITVHINPQTIIQMGNALLNLDLSLPTISDSSQNLHATVDLPQNLKFPSHPFEMQIRITAHTPQKLDFRILSIDNKPINSFIVSSPETTNSSSPAPLVQSTLSSTSSSVLPMVSNVQRHPLLPLRLQPLVTQGLDLAQISQTQISELMQILPDFQVKAEIVQVPSQVADSNYSPVTNSIPVTPNSSTQVPMQHIMSPSQLTQSVLPNNIIEQFIAVIKEFLPQTIDNAPSNVLPQSALSHNLSNQITLPKTPVTLPENTLQQLEQILQPLVGKEMPAKIVNKGELKVLQTPLGEIVPELPLKLETGKELILKISEIIMPKEGKMKMPEVAPLSNKIFEIIKPLQGQIPSDIYTSLVAKIPADNTKMLSNIISFLKAADSENIIEWLGQEITDTLRLSGVKGQDTLIQLENLILGRKEDNSQWRIIEVPFYGSENLRKISVAVRKYHQEESRHQAQNRKSDVARFVVDTSFTALGAFQFDGFSIAKEKRFDLIIRTEKDIGEDFCLQIMQLFRSSLSAVDYAGNIRINLKEKFIKLCDDKAENTILQDGIYI